MKRKSPYSVVVCLFGVYILWSTVPCIEYTSDTKYQAIPYDRNMDLIFIGGVPRSGTTLMRALLDAHPDVRCGEETHVIPNILQMVTEWKIKESEKLFLTESGFMGNALDSAVISFILEIIVKHGEAAPHLCNKDPLTMQQAHYLSQLFPQSRYIFMIRDGRAVVHSMIARKVTVFGFDLKSYRTSLETWDNLVDSMYGQCLRVGPYRCMPVYYEQLVLHTELWMRKILDFLNIPWSDSVLHHEDFVGKAGGISLSKTEKSTDQIMKSVNSEALSKWIGNIPDDVVQDMATIAPMLKTLGYDPDANPPDYRELVGKTLHSKKIDDF